MGVSRSTCLALARALALAGLALAGGGLLALAGLSTLASLARAGGTGAGLLAGAVGAGLGAGTVGRAGHCSSCDDGLMRSRKKQGKRCLKYLDRDYRYTKFERTSKQQVISLKFNLRRVSPPYWPMAQSAQRQTRHRHPSQRCGKDCESTPFGLSNPHKHPPFFSRARLWLAWMLGEHPVQFF